MLSKAQLADGPIGVHHVSRTSRAHVGPAVYSRPSGVHNECRHSEAHHVDRPRGDHHAGRPSDFHYAGRLKLEFTKELGISKPTM